MASRGGNLAVALGLAAVWTAAGGARADDAWRAWNAGPLSFEAPAAMSLSTDFDQKLDAARSRPSRLAVEARRRAGRRARADGEVLMGAGRLGRRDRATSEISRAAITFAGRPALRREWRDDDVATRGFDILAAGWGPKGAVFEFTCDADAKGWAKLQPNCERMAQSVRVAGLVATNSPPSPPTPRPSSRKRRRRRRSCGWKGRTRTPSSGDPRRRLRSPSGADILAETEHLSWNDGRGAAPGTMSLTGADGATLAHGARAANRGRAARPTSSDCRSQPAARAGTLRRAHVERRNLVDERETQWKGFYSIEYQLYPEVAQSTPPPPTPPPLTPAANTVWTPPPPRVAVFRRARRPLGEAPGVRRRLRRFRQARARRARR